MAYTVCYNYGAKSVWVFSGMSEGKSAIEAGVRFAATYRIEASPEFGVPLNAEGASMLNVCVCLCVLHDSLFRMARLTWARPCLPAGHTCRKRPAPPLGERMASPKA